MDKFPHGIMWFHTIMIKSKQMVAKISYEMSQFQITSINIEIGNGKDDYTGATNEREKLISTVQGHGSEKR